MFLPGQFKVIDESRWWVGFQMKVRDWVHMPPDIWLEGQLQLYLPLGS